MAAFSAQTGKDLGAPLRRHRGPAHLALGAHPITRTCTSKPPRPSRRGGILHKIDAGIRGHVFCSFLAMLLRKERFDRLAAHGRNDREWQNIIDNLDDLGEVEVEQDGRRALLRTAPGPTIDPKCRALGITLPPILQEVSAPAQTRLTCDVQNSKWRNG